MTREAARLAAALGVDRAQVRHHRDRWMTEFRLSGTDLVLTITRAHTARVTGLAPALASSVFRVREFARYARAIPTRRSSRRRMRREPTRAHAHGRRSA